MLISQRFTHLFSSRIRGEGERYYVQDKVQAFHTCPTHFFAVVKGTQDYLVGLDYLQEEKDLGVACSCPHYAVSGLCKHIWAALLATDERNALAKANNPATRLSLLEIDVMQRLIEDVEGEPYYNNSVATKGWVLEPQAGIKGGAVPSGPENPKPSIPKSKQKEWQRRLSGLRDRLAFSAPEAPPPRTKNDREIFYIINMFASQEKNLIVIDIGHRQQKKDGAWGLLKFSGIRASEIETYPNEIDRQILSIILRPEGTDSWRYYYNYSARMEYEISPTIAPILLPMMSAEQRLYISRSGDPKSFLPVRYDSGEGWEMFLRVDPEQAKPGGKESTNLELRMLIGNSAEEIALKDVERILPGGHLLVKDRLVRLADAEMETLLQPFVAEPSLTFSADLLDTVLQELAGFPVLPPVRPSETLSLETVSPVPKPTLRLRRQKQGSGEMFQGELLFDYQGLVVAPTDGRLTLLNPTEHRIILRNREAEQRYAQELLETGFSGASSIALRYNKWHISPRKFSTAVKALIEKDWTVEAEGKLYRSNGSLELQVSSGIDWFDIEGTASFDQTGASFPALLRAIAKGENMVLLDDGSYGLLPEEWVKRYAKLAKAVRNGSDASAVRFGSNQIVLLDMLLAELPEASFDETFRIARERLQSFEGVVPVNPPDSFVGELRPYQKLALGWFSFLREFGFGGCLADDMGLGKTVQALALLEERRLKRYAKKSKTQKDDQADHPQGPTLAVVPKSLIFNWIREAERFTPELRVLDYTGTARKEYQDSLHEFDLILTTYGTLRRDVPALREIEFDYIILDESQAIKNEKSATAKAVRLLNGRHRLAMSGTPIENRIEELWSLFEFLNPGMLGSATLFTALTGTQDSDDTRAALSRSLRPFILRRTKESVAADLPEKVEQTIFCELDKTQRRLYNELRDHYRASVLNEVDTKGMARSKIKVLEALLRLRQAACHPGLVDKTKGKLDCAKFDLLIPQLREIVEEGHKALVFSQFTSLLALLRTRLEEDNVNYVYLDGRTRNRQERVEQFQNDPEASLFLISLKAGGVGLNLTAAEYVFLLDPWWNPAVEAQAIDRTHRIGQTNNVFAYRLIAKNTVEEKVLELQEKKRELAQAIITGENAMVRDLAREDLEMLLS